MHRVLQVKFRSAGTGTLRVIDTPGLFDFEADPQECLSAMSQVVYSVPGGVHAFVFVLPFNQTLTDDDAQILLEMSLFFSKSILNYCFFLLNSYRSDFTPPDDLTDSLPEVRKFSQDEHLESLREVSQRSPLKICKYYLSNFLLINLINYHQIFFAVLKLCMWLLQESFFGVREKNTINQANFLYSTSSKNFKSRLAIKLTATV